MSNQHITAAFRCSKFKGTTRLVLLYLADAASSLSKKEAQEQKKLPFGFCKRKLTTIMAAVNCQRQPTISACLTELKEAGAIKQWRKKHLSALYFVDLKWLEENVIQAEAEDETIETIRKAFTQDEDLAEGNPGLTEANGNRIRSNGNRLVLNTESVAESDGNRLHSIPPLPTSSLRSSGFVPPSFVVADVPTASRDALTETERFAETQGDPVNPSNPLAFQIEEDGKDPLPVQSTPKAVAREIPPPPVIKRPAPRPEPKTMPVVDFTNPVRTHDWSKDKETCCVCGTSLDEAKFDRVTCQEAQAYVPPPVVEPPKAKAFDLEE